MCSMMLTDCHVYWPQIEYTAFQKNTLETRPMKNIKCCTVCVFATLVLFFGYANAQSKDPLPSWNNGTSKAKILEFVQKVTQQNGPEFIPKSDRIAVFDNDGTLWSEKPAYFQTCLHSRSYKKNWLPATLNGNQRNPMLRFLREICNPLYQAEKKR